MDFRFGTKGFNLFFFSKPHKYELAVKSMVQEIVYNSKRDTPRMQSAPSSSETDNKADSADHISV